MNFGKSYVTYILGAINALQYNLNVGLVVRANVRMYGEADVLGSIHLSVSFLDHCNVSYSG